MAPVDVGRWNLGLASAVLTARVDAAGQVDWAVSVDSTIARAHQHSTSVTRVTGGLVELHESGRRAA